MHRFSSTVLLALLALVASQNTCVTDGPSFNQFCVTLQNCTWSYVNLWGSCSGTYPDGITNTAVLNNTAGSFVMYVMNSVNIGALSIGVESNVFHQGVAIYNDSTLSVASTLEVNPTGLIAIDNGILDLGSQGVMTIDGTVHLYTASIIGSNNINIENDGNIVVMEGVQTINQTIWNFGSLALTNGSSLTLGNSATIYNNGTFTINGTSSLSGTGSQMICNEPVSFTGAGLVTLDVNTRFNDGLTVDAPLVVLSPLYANSLVANANVTFNTNGIVSINNFVNYNTVNFLSGNMVISYTNSLSNNGTFYFSSTGSFQSGVAFDNYGTVSVTTTTYINNNFTNNGILGVDAGQTLTTTNFNQYGQFNIDGALNVADFYWYNGDLSGVYTLNGTFSVMSNEAKTMNTLPVFNHQNTATVLDGSFVLAAGLNYTNAYHQDFYCTNGMISTYPPNAAGFVNQGVYQGGNLFLQGVDFYNYGTFGTQDTTSSLTVVDANLYLDATSSLVIGLTSDSFAPINVSRSNLHANASNTIVTINGQLTIVLQGNFSPVSGTVVSLFYLGQGVLFADQDQFNNITYIALNGSNTLNCTYAYNYNATSATPHTVHFDGCINVPLPPNNKARNLAILIVAIVVPVVVIIIIIIAVVIYRRRAHHATTAEKQRLI